MISQRQRRHGRIALIVSCVIAVACSSLGGTLGASAIASDKADALPEGDSGLAAKHPGDKGIEDDAAVIFVEKFDAGSLDEILVEKRWESVQERESMTLSDDVPAGSGDGASLLITHVGGEGTGGQLYRRLLPGYDRVFARTYVKFDGGCADIHHFGTHLGGFNPSTPWPQGGAGTLPDGDKRFTSGVEPFGKDWAWDFYSYWQGMRVHGDGRYWGTPFHAGVKRKPVKHDEWICVEMMLKMNAPGETDGEQTFWIDGKLWRVDDQITSHIGPGYPRGQWTGGWWAPDAKLDSSFEGFRWRDSDKLAINYLWTYLYITKAPRGHVSKVWFDNIVVAKEYIGPIHAQR